MVYISQIYTKSGDQGETGLGDGSRVPKDNPRVHAYGEVDELNCVLGLLRANVPTYGDDSLVASIQHDLFDLGADLCVPPQPNEDPTKALRITEEQVIRLEKSIDRVNEPIEPLRSFVLPGGSLASAWLHLARTVCRRAERAVITLTHTEPVNPQATIYLNRLSDLLFVLGRAANDGGRSDVLWVPGKSRGLASS